MGRGLFPDEMISSAYEIDYEAFYAKGYRGIIYDIDNTLVLPDAPADERAAALFECLHGIGFQAIVLSNNKGPRVSSFAEGVNGGYVAGGGKPLPRGYRQAMKQMGTDPEHTLFVGDQIFTDVWGANACGLYTILTRPFTRREEIQIILKRILEWPILALYKATHRREQ